MTKKAFIGIAAIIVLAVGAGVMALSAGQSTYSSPIR